ncbi:MAG: signal peptidase I [Candidatus Nanopelagicales bacterium]|nr:signal peptidase I [Candidatus Nanopelagicales bacterium]
MARPVNDAENATGAVGPERSREWFTDAPDCSETIEPGVAVAGRGRHAAPTGSHRSRRWLKAGRWAAEVVAVVVIAVLIVTGIRVFVAQPFYVPSSAMEPTLMAGDRLLGSSLMVRLGGVQRGEVIVFADPGGWNQDLVDPATGDGPVRSGLEFLGLMPSDAPGDRILRVIGIAGDTVTCCDPQGRILLNGIALDESYLPAGTATDQRDFTVVVPADSVFVLGDDRETAVDSRSYLDLNSGAVALTKVRARVLFVLWPLDRVGWISTPSAFNQAGAPANP